MQAPNSTVAVGVFHDRTRAQQALHELRQMGFSDSQLGLAAHGEPTTTDNTVGAEKSQAGSGAAVGAAAGLGAGGLWGLGVIAGAIPAIGPVIAGGALAAVIASAATGAVVGGLAGTLVGLGIPKDEAEYYHGEFEQGGTIVTVQAGERYDEAKTLLQSYGAYDVHSRGDASVRPTSQLHVGTPEHNAGDHHMPGQTRVTPDQSHQV